ncbi:hypothetical protein COB47_0437 [Caldicellulosiruptor obsidiansis OB47]|uniref:Uncharacterized protein n=1 Tax=Caldicellulosiruptor obsidiansis (strain ATCC BAA-2073 / JCM 16842 / OB47) TaxID=608506 RepID=D9TID6_CALOO|nr:hypothetical protein [Caldicellulosiruptor obsidiansis]ADL41768.1 hypothetical protein COB47_0437 [Caldicellulosiruptor obsidiansis OB47]
MKRKIIYIHIIFLIIMVLILSFLYKNYSIRRISFEKASENLKVKLLSEIQSAVKLTDYIISNFDKDGFSEENILLLEYKSKVIYESIRHILSAVEIDKDNDYFIRIRSIENTFEILFVFLNNVYNYYIKDGGTHFNLPNSNKIVIKSKKNIYNELLLYHDLFSKLDITNKENYKGIELFNKIIEKWDTKKAELIIYPDERT